MRVLIVFDWFWSYVAPQATALAQHGTEVALLCRSHADEFDGDQSERRRFLEQVQNEGITVFEVPGRFRSARAAAAAVLVRRQVRAWRPDVVHAHDNYDPRLLAIVSGLPRIVTIHDPTPHPGATTLHGLRWAVRRRWIDGAACLVVHGKSLRERLSALEPAARIAVIPHGAQVNAAAMAVPGDPPTLLLFGRRETYKGLSLLVDAMQRIWLRRSEIRLVIAGRGSDSSLGSFDDARVELRDGYIPESELDDLFARARLVVLPYLEASQSGVALQALGRGVPIVATAVGAIPELVPSDAFLAAPHDPDSFAERVLQWVDHSSSVRANVLERTRETSSWESVANQTLELYRSVLGATG
jgi:glycosyltransferase involved in cell wall biosynthesis